MLIDINANIGHWPFRQTNCNTCQELLDRMKKYEVDISVVSNMNGIFYKDTQASNEELHKEILSSRHFRDRFIPFAIINPIYGGWKNDLEICRTKMGMKGIRLYPQYHDYELTDPACIELVKTARDHGMIVAFTIRMVDSRPRSWMDISKEWSLKDIVPIVKEVPDAKYMILNVSNGIQSYIEDVTNPNIEEETNQNGKKINLLTGSNVLFDTSGKNLYNLGKLLTEYGKDMFAFGTHSPILDYVTGLLRIEALRSDEADDATKDLLRSGNAKRFLGI